MKTLGHPTLGKLSTKNAAGTVDDWLSAILMGAV
jgi:hypothetical protein